MKPQDIIVLAKIFTKGKEPWRLVDLAQELDLSIGEISNGLQRLKTSGLIDAKKKVPILSSVKEFIIHGLKYIFPAEMGPIARGVPTAHSVGVLSKKIVAETKFIWPSVNGSTKGIGVSPLYPNVPAAALRDKKLHHLLALIDSIRIGRAREQKLAIKELNKKLSEYEL